MVNRIKVHKKSILIFFFTIFSLFSLIYIYIYYDMYQHHNVSFQISSNADVLYFYRDNCATCRKNYHKEFLKSVFYTFEGKKIIFVNTKNINTNDNLNRRLVNRFNIKHVPTEIFLKKDF